MILRIYLFVISICVFNSLFSQSISIKSINELSIDYKINEIVQIEKIKQEGQEHIAVLANIRGENYDINGLILLFDNNGKLLKSKEIGDAEHIDRIVGMTETDEDYTILINQIHKTNNEKEIVLHFFKKDIFPQVANNAFRTSAIAKIPNLVGATAISSVRNVPFIVASVTDENDNLYPVLLARNPLTGQTKVFEKFDTDNRYELPTATDLEEKIRVGTKDENGNHTTRIMTKKEMIEAGYSVNNSTTKKPLLKECNSIKVIDGEAVELLLVGQETSKNNTDFWVAKVIIGATDSNVSWEDEYQTKLGGDEGHKIFITENGYLIFGLDYTKNINSYYSYRTLLLNNDGEEISNQKFNTGNKDWYKDVIQVAENQYLIFGQTQTITLAKSMFEEEKINTSNLWFVLVDEKGEKISDYKHETTSLDIADKLVQLADGSIIGIYQSDTNFKMITFEIEKP